MAPSLGRPRNPALLPVDPRFLPLPAWVRDDVRVAAADWQIIRDCIAGEGAIKARGSFYLPQLEGLDGANYAAFLEGASWFGFVPRAAEIIVEGPFRYPETIVHLPAHLGARPDSRG